MFIVIDPKSIDWKSYNPIGVRLFKKQQSLKGDFWSPVGKITSVVLNDCSIQVLGFYPIFLD